MRSRLADSLQEKPWRWRAEMPRLILGLGGIFVLSVVGLALGPYKEGPAYPVGFMVVFALVLGGSSVIAGVVMPFNSWRIPPSLLRTAVASVGLIVVCLLDLPAGEIMWKMYSRTLETYPAKVAVQLEDYRKAHGNYPSSLDAIPGLPPLPLELMYWTDDSTYFFSYNDPWSMFGGYQFDVAGQKWVHSVD